MGVKPTQGEVNTTLRPPSTHILQARPTHEEIDVAAPNDTGHEKAIEEVMKFAAEARIALNLYKTVYLPTYLSIYLSVCLSI